MSNDQRIEVQVAANVAQLQSGMQQAVSSVQSAASGIQSGFGKMEAISGTIGAIRGPIVAMAGALAASAIVQNLKQAITHTADLGDSLIKTSQKVGVSVESLSRLRYVAQLSDVSFESLSGALGKLSRNMSEAASNAKSGPAEAFKSIGVAVVDSEGNLRKGDAVLLDLAEKFKGMEDGAGKTALAMEIFGRSGAQLIPFLNAGKDGIAELSAEAEKLGVVMTTESAAAAEEFNDNMTRLQEIGNSLMQAFGNELIPILSSVAKSFIDSAKEGSGFADVMKGVGYVVKVVMTQFYTFKAVVETLTTAIAAYVMSLVTVFTTLGSVIAKVAKGDFKGAWEEAKAGARSLKTEWEAAGEGIAASWKKMAANTKNLWNPAAPAAKEESAKGKAPKPKNKEDEAAAKERERLAREAMMREHEAIVEGMKAQMDALQNNAAERLALQDKVIAEETRIHGVGSKEVISAEREKARIVRDLAAEEMALKVQLAQFTRDYKLAEIEQDAADLEFRRQLGQVSADEELQALVAMEDRKLAAKQAAIDAALQDQTLSQQQVMELLNEAELLEQEHQARIREIRQRAVLEQRQEIQNFLQPLTSAFQSSLDGLLAGTMSWSNAMRNIWRGLGQVMDQAIRNMVMAWLTGEKVKTLGTQAGVLQRFAAESWGAIKSVGLAIWTGMKWIAIKGYEAAAGAYSAIASIPYVGPFLAPVMAGAALAAVLGMGARIASAAGGYDIPSGVNPLVQAHAQEMILPAKYADVIRGMADGGGGGGSASGDSFNVTMQFMDSRGAEDFLRRHQGALVKVIKEAAGNRRMG